MWSFIQNDRYNYMISYKIVRIGTLHQSTYTFPNLGVAVALGFPFLRMLFTGLPDVSSTLPPSAIARSIARSILNVRIHC